MPNLQRFKIMLNQCRGVLKLSLERVQVRSEADEKGRYRSVVMRIFGANHHRRFDTEQGMTVLKGVEDMLNQLCRNETVTIEDIAINIGSDDIRLTRAYKMPNI